MEKMNGLETSKRILQGHRDAKILIITQFDEYSLRESAKQIGTIGYLLKDDLVELSNILNLRKNKD